MEINKIYHGDCLDVLKTFEDNSIDSCVTDAPYGLSFMNKHWDYDVPKVEVWKEVLRVLKPGGHLLCACGTRTQHRMACNIEDAGFEIRDVITWHYGSGFPKSLDISKAIDKYLGVDRVVTGTKETGADKPNGKGTMQLTKKTFVDVDGKTVFATTASATAEGKEYEGWGTALKPATEFWTLARKPLSENTVALNVLKHGTGAINIDGCRIEFRDNEPDIRVGTDILKKSNCENKFFDGLINERESAVYKEGRFPANVIFDKFAGKVLDEQTGVLTSGTVSPEGFKGDYTAEVYGKYANNIINPENVYGDSGGASRFFYCPKADGGERNKGLKEFEDKDGSHANESGRRYGGGNRINWEDPYKRPAVKNNHPTVKPIDLMRYLVKLITPKKGICLDPYCGSGTTLIGCKLELINYIGIEMEENYCKISEARVAAWNPDKYKPQTLF